RSCWHEATQATHVAQVLRVSFAMRGMVGGVERVNDGTCTEKEQRLEERVRDEMKDAGTVCTHANADEHVAELRHRGVRKHLLDVPLAERNRRGKQRGQCTNCRHDKRCVRCAGKDWCGARHEINTC